MNSQRIFSLLITLFLGVSVFAGLSMTAIVAPRVQAQVVDVAREETAGERSGASPLDFAYLGNYFRPDMAREVYQDLTGKWELEYDIGDVGIGESWFADPAFTRKINVPYCVESEASGVYDLNPPSVIWYARRFADELPETPGRTLLHFGAVDYRAQVWLNGHYLGEHKGGYTPFSFEVGGYLEEENLLVVRVEDTNDLSLPRGKQSQLGFPWLFFYETVTGIWQPVWLERTGEIYLDGYRSYPDLETGKVRLVCRLAGGTGKATVKAVATSPTGARSRAMTRVKKGVDPLQVELTLACGDLLPWSPGEPNLYGLKIVVECGSSFDEVHSYFGARTIEARDGNIWLNGEPLYQKLVFVHGYYPQGHYTPTHPDAYRKDVELVREYGFNGLRLHIKVEAPPFYFWCDYLGCLVLQDMPSAYAFSDTMKEAFEREWRDVIEVNFNHPSIVTWVPFNECWGVGCGIFPFLLLPEANAFVKHIYHRTKEWDTTRPVIDNSGYDHTTVTDILDVHHYLRDLERCQAFYDELKDLFSYRWSLLRALLGVFFFAFAENPIAKGESYRGQPIIITEYGGFDLPYGEDWHPFVEEYRAQTTLIHEQEHILGYTYVELTDTYQSIGGLVDFHRRYKVPPEEIKAINDLK